MEDNFEILEQPTPPKNRCIIVGSAIEEEYKIFINYATISKSLKHGLKDTINEMGGVLVGNIYSDKRIDDDFLYVDVKDIYPVARVGVKKKFSFTEEELENLKGEIKEKHPDSSIVGWYHSHPGWGVDLSEDDQDTHMSFFGHKWNVLLVVESVAKDFSIYVTDEEEQKAIKSKGYVIYCETNDDIPKMKKLFDMVEQNRERKKDKVIKVPEEELENKPEKEESQEFYLNIIHPNVIMAVLASIIVVLIIVLIVGKGKLDLLKRQQQYSQGSFNVNVETKDGENGIKEIFLDGDFIEETIKIVAYTDESGEKWNIKEIYVQKSGSPFQLVARLEVPTPAPVSEETPGPSETVVSEDVTPVPDMTPSSDSTPSVAEEENEELLKEQVMGWVGAWEAGNVEEFKSFYSNDFSNSLTDKMDLWIERKVTDGVFEGNPRVGIEGDIEVKITGEDKAEVVFIQDFQGSFSSKGKKILEFTKEDGKWLITGEDFESY